MDSALTPLPIGLSASFWSRVELQTEIAARRHLLKLEAKGLAGTESADLPDEPLEFWLGRSAYPPRIAQARHRDLRDLGRAIMARRRKPPSQAWRTFLESHLRQIVAVDFFLVPSLVFRVLFVFVVLPHDRRRILPFNFTAHSTAEGTAQRTREAFPWVPRRGTLAAHQLRDEPLDLASDSVIG